MNFQGAQRHMDGLPGLIDIMYISTVVDRADVSSDGALL